MERLNLKSLERPDKEENYQSKPENGSWFTQTEDKMKRFYAIFMALVLVTAGITSPSLAQTSITQLEPLTPLPSTDSGEMVDETAEMWFVELSSAPLADGGNGAAMQKDKANFTAEARKADIYYSPRLSFDTLWNGISVWATPSEAVKITRLPGVKTI